MSTTETQTFAWEAIDLAHPGPDGRATFVTGKMEATSPEAVASHLRADRGFEPVKVRARKRGLALEEISLSKLLGRVSRKQMALAYRQLASLVRSGLTISESLNSVAEGTKDIAVRDAVRTVAEEVAEGKVLADGMAKRPEVFSVIEIELLRAASETGTQAETLERIAKMTETQVSVQRKIRSALLMPGFALVASLAAAVFVATSVVPDMAKMLYRLDPDAELPLPTRLMVGLADNILMVSIVSVVLITGIYFLNRLVLSRSEPWLEMRSRVALRFPVVSTFVKLTDLAAFSRGFEMMLAAGILQMPALRSLGPTMKNRQYRMALERIEGQMLNGRQLSEEMSRFPQLFPFTFISMVRGGEKAGELDVMMRSTADETEAQLKAFSDGLGEAVQPLAMGLIAVVLGVLASGIYGPVLAIAQAV